MIDDNREAKIPTLTEENQKELPTFLASLYFLTNEARRIGLPEISNFFKDTINNIESWLKSGKGGRIDINEVVGRDLFLAMQTLEECSKLHREEQEKMLSALDHYDRLKDGAN